MAIFQMWSLCANENLLYRVMTKAKACPESYGHGITSPENQMWSWCANENLLYRVITKAKALPKSVGHEVFSSHSRNHCSRVDSFFLH
jgi:hypothetical protein